MIMAKANPLEFLRQVRQEAAKVSWPTRKEVGVGTALVFVFATLAALFFMFVDWLIAMGVEAIIGLGLGM